MTQPGKVRTADTTGKLKATGKPQAAVVAKALGGHSLARESVCLYEADRLVAEIVPTESRHSRPEETQPSDYHFETPGETLAQFLRK